MRNKLLIPFAMTGQLALNGAAFADHEVDFLPPWESKAIHRGEKQAPKTAQAERRQNRETYADGYDHRHVPRSGYD
jgi:hypothetical protein